MPFVNKLFPKRLGKIFFLKKTLSAHIYSPFSFSGLNHMLTKHGSLWKTDANYKAPSDYIPCDECGLMCASKFVSFKIATLNFAQVFHSKYFRHCGITKTIHIKNSQMFLVLLVTNNPAIS